VLENLIIVFLKDVELIGVTLILTYIGRVNLLIVVFRNLTIVSLKDVELINITFILNYISRRDKLNLKEIYIIVALF